MKAKLTAMTLALLLLVGALAGCSSNAASGSGSSSNTASSSKAGSSSNTASSSKAGASSTDKKTEVNLKNMYTVKDPAGISYDTRTTLYKPVLKSDEDYAAGARYIFSVIYGKDNNGQYMYSVVIFETEKQAAAYKDSNGKGKGKVDGKAYVTENDANFFEKMKAYVPTLKDWFDNQKQSGMMELEQ